MSQTGNHGMYLRLRTSKWIKTRTLHFLIEKVRENNIKRVKRVEKVRKATEVKKTVRKIR